MTISWDMDITMWKEGHSEYLVTCQGATDDKYCSLESYLQACLPQNSVFATISSPATEYIMILSFNWLLKEFSKSTSDKFLNISGFCVPKWLLKRPNSLKYWLKYITIYDSVEKVIPSSKPQTKCGDYTYTTTSSCLSQLST